MKRAPYLEKHYGPGPMELSLLSQIPVRSPGSTWHEKIQCFGSSEQKFVELEWAPGLSPLARAQLWACNKEA